MNVVSTGDEVKLDDTTTPFAFIWVAVSSKNTIVKINTLSGATVGEYWSAPQSSGKGDPSRTTVDKNGSVWVGNRNGGSVVHIGLEENGQCVDRNGNKVIDTSTGQGDVRNWPGALATDADDECVTHYTQTANGDIRHVSVNADNDVWISGVFNRIFQLIDGDTGAIIRTEGPVGYGGYGGLIDANGVIWSARPLLRWDTDTPALNPLSGPAGGTWTAPGVGDSYGLCIDPAGNVWNTSLGEGVIRKYDSSGALIGTFGQGNGYAQGCVADTNGDIWVAHSLIGSNTVGHLKNDGSYVGTVSVGNGPTGVAVDAAGKVWSTNYNDGTVSRIDPALAGGVDAVDFTSAYLGGNNYNYSDMTGSTLIGAPGNGTYTLVHDTGTPGAQWGTVSWNAVVVGNGSLTMTAATSVDGSIFSTPVAVTNAGALTVPDGQYIRVVVSFARATTGESPVLNDLTFAIVSPNEAPVYTAAAPSTGELWPPNHRFVGISILGLTDPDGDPLTITIDSIRQDEPVRGSGDGNTGPDGAGIGTSVAQVRAERSGTPKQSGNGRVYHIGFTADDGNGGTCSGTVKVGVPHDQGKGKPAIDGGPLYDSTIG